MSSKYYRVRGATGKKVRDWQQRREKAVDALFDFAARFGVDKLMMRAGAFAVEVRLVSETKLPSPWRRCGDNLWQPGRTTKAGRELFAELDSLTAATTSQCELAKIVGFERRQGGDLFDIGFCLVDRNTIYLDIPGEFATPSGDFVRVSDLVYEKAVAAVESEAAPNPKRGKSRVE